MKKPNRRWRVSTVEERRLAKVGLEWIRAQRLEVILIPAPDPRHVGHMIRVAVDQNPGWYRRMAEARGFDVRPKRYGPLRKYVIGAFKRLLSGWYDPIGLEHEILMELQKDLEDMNAK